MTFKNIPLIDAFAAFCRATWIEKHEPEFIRDGQTFKGQVSVTIRDGRASAGQPRQYLTASFAELAALGQAGRVIGTGRLVGMLGPIVQFERADWLILQMARQDPGFVVDSILWVPVEGARFPKGTMFYDCRFSDEPEEQPDSKLVTVELPVVDTAQIKQPKVPTTAGLSFQSEASDFVHHAVRHDFAGDILSAPSQEITAAAMSYYNLLPEIDEHGDIKQRLTPKTIRNAVSLARGAAQRNSAETTKSRARDTNPELGTRIPSTRTRHEGKNESDGEI